MVSSLYDLITTNVVTVAIPRAISIGTSWYTSQTAIKAEPNTSAAAISSGQLSDAVFLTDFATAAAGFPNPKYSASFGQTLTQSIHFIQPESTTIPYFATSAWTSTFDVQVAVQWPHWLHASVTRMRPGATLSARLKNPPYGQA